ncbi:MAG: hypothetical protein ACPGQL_03965 [Thermoplasmatota archaeon]
MATQELLDLKDLQQQVRQLPQHPVDRAHPRNWAFRAKRAADFVGHARPGSARFFATVNPYPKPFRHVKFRSEDGVQIAAWLGPQHAGQAPSPFGIVIVPGMFSTKDDTVHKRRAIRLWRHWRIPVIAIDMRSFGESRGISTGGWKEALDVHGAAKLLARETGVKRVGVIAESMGGAAALNAAAHDAASGTHLLHGGVLTFSAFVDTRDAVGHISTRPVEGHAFRTAFDGFQRLLMYKSHGGYNDFASYMADAARVNGLPNVDELYDLANPKWKVHLMECPILAVHAVDDPVVPVRHARRMQRYARDRANIATVLTDWGAHTGFEPMDPVWFWEVLRRFFGHVNGVTFPNLEQKE